MKVLFAGHNKQDRESIEKLLVQLGCDSETCSEPSKFWELLESSCRSSIVLLPIEDESWSSEDVLRKLKTLKVDQALYVIGTSQVNGEPSRKILESGINDHFDLNADSQTLLKKLEKGKDAVTIKQSLIDSTEVMERYSQHIDRIAEERARQLVHAERLSTLGVMSAGIAHEINTPIGFMSTSLETVKVYWDELQNLIDSSVSKDELSPIQLKALERVPRALERIEKGLDKVVNVTQGLKHFGQASRTDRDRCEVNTCIREAVEVAEHAVQKTAEVRLHLEDPSPAISGHAQQIEQVVVNLMVNAAHALEEYEGEKFIDITSTQQDEWITLVIEDNGPGIPEDIIDTIWQSFFTTKEEGKGTGLGLAISREIIRDHSGSINVSNKDEGGARFEIRLPAIRE